MKFFVDSGETNDTRCFIVLAPRSGRFSEITTRKMKIPFGNRRFYIDLVTFRGLGRNFHFFTFRGKFHIQEGQISDPECEISHPECEKKHWSQHFSTWRPGWGSWISRAGDSRVAPLADRPWYNIIIMFSLIL